MLDIDQWPDLDDPVFVVALSGWVDAGLAGAGAAAALVEQLESARRFGTLDLSDLVDLQQTRPTVALVDGTTREITWPSMSFIAGRLGRDVVICTGPEPSIRWRAVTDELVTMCRYLKVRMAVGLGGMPAVVSHRRPVPVLATGNSRSVAEEVGALRTDYTGPTGLQTLLQVALGAAAIPGVGLWAQVPHYVAASPSPPGIRALLQRLREVAGLTPDTSVLDASCDEYRAKVDEGLADRPDVAEIVREIESGTTELPSGHVPSGDELASEIERFLREQG